MNNEYLHITELISADVIQRLQDSFSAMTGFASITVDENGMPITSPSNFSDFCLNYTRESPLGCNRCMRCDKSGAESSWYSKKICRYYCHAGLLEFSAPIVVNNKLVGSLVSGQVLTVPPNMEQIKKTAAELGIDLVAYQKAASKIKIVSENDIAKASEFLSSIADGLSFLASQSYELHKSNIEIEKASQMKSDFLANMSHEIRTPMNAVMGMADLALRENMSDKARSYMHQIKDAAKTLLVIINDILDFSKIESGKMDIVGVPFEPLSLIHDLSSIVSSRIGNKNIEFTMDVPPEMPKTLFGDNIRIHQILLNIVNNAVKFTENGEVHIKFEFTPDKNDHILLKVDVSDTGIGIKPENLNKLFNSFQQLDSKRNRNIEGTGLGLAICKSLLVLMNGNISVKSEYGKGSTFSVQLPLKMIDKTMSLPTLSHTLRVGILISDTYVRNQLLRDLEWINTETAVLHDADTFDTSSYEFIIMDRELYSDTMSHFFSDNPQIKCILVSKYDAFNDIECPNVTIIHKPVYSISLYNAMGISDIKANEENSDADSFDFIAPDARVLIVDDNSVNLLVASGLIEPLEMIVDTVESAAQAIEAVRKVKYDIIFMDHMMPEVDGVEATHIIRRMFPAYANTPIIALTANAVGDAKDMFIREGMSDFCPKPIEIKDIVSKIRRWLPQDKIIPVNKKNKQSENSVPDIGTPKIQGLDVDKAISMLGSEKLFFSVLKEYYQTIDKKARSIQEHRWAEHWREYTIEVHALKSTSRQIGADKVGDLAYELEMAGKEGNINLINEKTDRLIEEYVKYKSVLSHLFPDEPDEQTGGHADKETVISLLNDMLEAIHNFDILQIDDVFAKIAKYEYCDAQKVFLDELKNTVDECNIDESENIITEWKEHILSSHDDNLVFVNNDKIIQLLDSLQSALNNFDTLLIDDAINELLKFSYKPEQRDVFNELKASAEISDIDKCCELVSNWKMMLC